MAKSKSEIPDRWKDYSNIGEVIEGTRFITFKVPLKETISVPKDLKFTPEILLETLRKKKVQLGLLVDLTNTTKYYDKTEFEKNGVLYEKIFVPGHVIPTDDIFECFSYTVDQFLQENADSLVGVHCTHGLNRTGYMVCRYMIERLGIDPEVAITAYGEARGCNIERENYLEDLRQRGRRKTSSAKQTKVNPVSQEQFSSTQQWNYDRSSPVHPQYKPYNRFAGHRGNSGPGTHQRRQFELNNVSNQDIQLNSNHYSHQGRQINSNRRQHQGRQKGNDYCGYQGRQYNKDYEHYQGRQGDYGHGTQWARPSNLYSSNYQEAQFEIPTDSQWGGEHRYGYKSQERTPGTEHEPFFVRRNNQGPHFDSHFRFMDQSGNCNRQAETLNDSSAHFHEEPKGSSGRVGKGKRKRKKKRKPEQQATN